MPKAEQILWQYLKGKQLSGYKFRRQYSVGAFIVDFYCIEAKLAIELDGDSHFEEGVAGYDQKRQRFIENLGIRVLRFTNHEIYFDLDNVLEVIKTKL